MNTKLKKLSHAIVLLDKYLPIWPRANKSRITYPPTSPQGCLCECVHVCRQNLIKKVHFSGRKTKIRENFSIELFLSSSLLHSNPQARPPVPLLLRRTLLAHQNRSQDLSLFELAIPVWQQRERQRDESWFFLLHYDNRISTGQAIVFLICQSVVGKRLDAICLPFSSHCQREVFIKFFCQAKLLAKEKKELNASAQDFDNREVTCKMQPCVYTKQNFEKLKRVKSKSSFTFFIINTIRIPISYCMTMRRKTFLFSIILICLGAQWLQTIRRWNKGKCYT